MTLEDIKLGDIKASMVDAVSPYRLYLWIDYLNDCSNHLMQNNYASDDIRTTYFLGGSGS
jgi:hypothetical protein